MNKIEKLIKELCPEGVRHFYLEELFDLRNGYTPSKANSEFWTDGSVPWFRMEDIRKNGRVLRDAIQLVSKSAVKSGRYFEDNSLVVATTATIGEHALIEVPFLANQQFTILTIKQRFKNEYIAKFGFYVGFLLSRYCQENTNISGFDSVDMEKFRKFNFPLPPLQVQRKIVSILDKFTALEAELEAELEARSTQSETYREEILFSQTSNLSSAETPIGDLVSKISSIKWADENTTLKYVDLSSVNIDFSEILSFTPVNKASAPSRAQQVIKDLDVLFGTTRPTLRRIAFVSPEFDGALASTGFCVLRPNLELIHPRYLFHIVSSKKFLNYVEQHQLGASYPSISNSKVLEFNFPLPTLGTQKKRLEILDAFNVLVKSSVNSLPAEIQARRKQYEYYRRKLLTFKEIDAA